MTQLFRKISSYWNFFWLQFQALPPALIRRCAQHMSASATALALTLIMLYYFRQWVFACGFLFAVYLLWPVYTITKGHFEGTVFGVDMILQKITRPLKVGDRCILYFRTADTQAESVSFYMYLTKKQRQWLTEGMTLTLFLSKDNPTEILAWEFVALSV